MMDEVASLSADEPWGSQVIAGLLAFEREPVDFDWPDVPPAIARLGLACAMRGYDWPMSAYNEGWYFALDQKRVAAFQLGGAKGEAFVLLEMEAKYPLRYVVTAESKVLHVDDEELAREVADLETFCRRLLSAWLSVFEDDDDYEPDLPVPDAPDEIARYFRALGARRTELANQLAPVVADLEAQIGRGDESLYDEWSAKGDRLTVLQARPPWPTWHLACKVLSQ